MPRYKLTIAYDGTDFCGWQKQEPPAGTDVRPDLVLAECEGTGEDVPSAVSYGLAPEDPAVPRRLVLRTVQEVVERAARSLVGEPVIVMGASRTDSGVHARGQVAAFTCGGSDEETDLTGDSPAEPPTSPLPHLLTPPPPQRGRGWPLSRGTDRLAAAINARLPADVVVVAAEAVDPAFDPISDCIAKGYSYTLHVGPERPLFDRQFVHHVRTPLDVDAMRRAAGRIVGEHDFAAFAKAGHGRESTVRTVFECRVVEEGTKGRGDEGTKESPERTSGRLRIEVSGSGFLYNMVRIIAGTLVDAGRGKLTPDDVAAAIETGDRRRAGPTLPPQGLCLEWIRYPEQQNSRTPEQMIDV